jgi:methyl-accepting chemotaxis protein
MPRNRALKSKKSTLARKFSILLVFIFGFGMILSGTALAVFLTYEAQNQIKSKALLLMDTMNSVQDYTSNEVTPQLQKRIASSDIVPQTIPSYAAVKVFERLRQSNDYYKHFHYKYAMLNSTSDPSSFELGIALQFRQDKNLKQLQGFRYIGNQQFLYIARPLLVTKYICLNCQTQPKSAKPTQNTVKSQTRIQTQRKIAKPTQNFPTNKIFKTITEMSGTQIVFVPLIKVLQNYWGLFVSLLGILAIIFAITIFMVNLWLKRDILKPISKIVQVAEAVSTGDMDAEFEKEVSNDEIGSLVEAFTRMKLSLAMAIKKFEQYRIKSRKTIDLGG